LPVAIATAATSTTTAAPTTLLLHVIQHLKLDPLSNWPQRTAATDSPRRL
jgi:hypothetical protein